MKDIAYENTRNYASTMLRIIRFLCVLPIIALIVGIIVVKPYKSEYLIEGNKG